MPSVSASQFMPFLVLNGPENMPTNAAGVFVGVTAANVAPAQRRAAPDARAASAGNDLRAQLAAQRAYNERLSQGLSQLRPGAAPKRRGPGLRRAAETMRSVAARAAQGARNTAIRVSSPVWGAHALYSIARSYQPR